jgi:hypothetical protein
MPSLADLIGKLLEFATSHRLGSPALTEAEFGQLVELDMRVGILARKQSLPLPVLPATNPRRFRFLSHTHLPYYSTNFGRRSAPSVTWRTEMEALRHLAGEAASPADPAAATVPPADGPEAPNYLWLGGTRYPIGNPRSRRSWQLLEYFWTRTSETYDNLQGPTGIWQDCVTDSAIASAVNRFNNDMPAELPWKLTTHHHRVVKNSCEIPAT